MLRYSLLITLLVIAAGGCGKKEQTFNTQTQALEKAKQTEQQIMQSVEAQKRLIEKQTKQ